MPPKAKTEDAKTQVDGEGITELEKFEPTRVDGVKAGANGFPILMMKALPAPMLTGQGFQDLGSQAHAAMRQATAEDVTRRLEGHALVDVVKAGRPDWHAAAATLARLGAAAPAVPAAALLKAIGADGQVDETADIDGGQQAIALIAKLIGYEADELAAGCLDESYDIGLLVNAIECLKCWLRHEQDGQDAQEETMEGIVMDAAKAAGAAVVAEETKSVDTEGAERDKELIKSLVADAVTEATKGAQEEIASLRVELAKVKATPIPGGPVMSIAQPPTAVRNTDRTAKAADYRRLADQVSDPDTADAYRQLARNLDEAPTS